MSRSCRYTTSKEPQVPRILIRTVTWICQWCDQEEQETKEVTVPTDRLKIIRRFLSLSDDYDLLELKVEAKADELMFYVHPNGNSTLIRRRRSTVETTVRQSANLQ